MHYCSVNIWTLVNLQYNAQAITEVFSYMSKFIKWTAGYLVLIIKSSCYHVHTLFYRATLWLRARPIML